LKERRGTEIRAGERTGRAACEGDPPRDPTAVFRRGEDPHRFSGLRGEDSIVELCRREGIGQNLYYRWSKEFLEAGKKRLAGDTARTATSDEVKELRREASALKEVVAELTLENRLLKA
jgi:transposase